MVLVEMQLTNIHPFPARMAPELALSKTEALPVGSVILDPMAGSGTVLQAAGRHGHRCIGFDVDPLAVMISKVSTCKLHDDRFLHLVDRLIETARVVDLRSSKLPWFDKETREFSEYWFATHQRRALSRLAYVLNTRRAFLDGSPESIAVRIALSRLIITKDRGASLARDVSHSRPHRVTRHNDFDVYSELYRSAQIVKSRLAERPQSRRALVRCGDARVLPWIRDHSVDMVMTSPPYLNAIDYMRGHRLSLIWLGRTLRQLRDIRSNSVGAERGPDNPSNLEEAQKISGALGRINNLPSRERSMIDRYSLDLLLIATQTARVLKPSGRAIFVVGNSCLRDVFVSNARGLEVAAHRAGLKLVDESVRKLPTGSRYLPMPETKTSALGRRMRTEAILTFEPARRAA
jgi:DNA modification methylase